MLQLKNYIFFLLKQPNGERSELWTEFIGLFESGAQMISVCTFLQHNIESVKTKSTF